MCFRDGHVYYGDEGGFRCGGGDGTYCREGDLVVVAGGCDDVVLEAGTDGWAAIGVDFKAGLMPSLLLLSFSSHHKTYHKNQYN